MNTRPNNAARAKETIEAPPDATPSKALKFALCGVLFPKDAHWRPTGECLVTASFSFGEDGGFCVTPEYRDAEGRRHFYPSIIGDEGMTAREFVGLLMTLPPVTV